MDLTLLSRIDQIADRIVVLSVEVSKVATFVENVHDHENRLKKIEVWQARLIGGYFAGATIIGIAFQFLLRLVS